MFKQQFRFVKGDFDDLARGLLMPEFVTSSQDVVVPGRETLCLTLRRLAYPNRWCDLEPIFGRHASVMSSVTSQVLEHISQTFGHLLTNLNNHEWLTPARMVEFASVSRPPVPFAVAVSKNANFRVLRPRWAFKEPRLWSKVIGSLPFRLVLCLPSSWDVKTTGHCCYAVGFLNFASTAH